MRVQAVMAREAKGGSKRTLEGNDEGLLDIM